MPKNLLFTIVFLFFYSPFFAQIHFEEGYYINNANQKTICLIKNQDWKNNPVEFYYKIAENSEIKKASIQTISEFEINNDLKYRRFEVDIDRSSNLTEHVSAYKEPIFKKENLFLKVVVEGNATLYSYASTNLKRYFFSTENKTIEQLVYKKHITSNNSFSENNYYKQQLANNLKCKNITINRFENIKYDQKDLTNLFIDFNEFGKYTYSVYSKKKKENIHLSIRPGINSSSFSMINVNSVATDPYVFDNEISFRIGLEVAYILPFNNEKWAIIIEPAYNYYKSETYDNFGHVTADIKSIDLSVGVRYFLFLTKDSKLFANSSFLSGLGLNSRIKIDGYLIETSKFRNNMVLGLGYKYRKYSIELKYDTKSDVFDLPWVSDHQRASVVFGYTIF